jgi:FKBP-type peptidyl-prolyl cis-trans isomerase
MPIKIVAVALLLGVSVFACKKKNDVACMPVDPADEASQLAGFCTTNSISYTMDSNGIYYQIVDQGSGVRPKDSSLITVTYTASTLDNKIIEDKTNDPVTAMLSQFIEGWRIAIPYIQKGGHIKMVLPSALAYGCTGSDLVAPNTPLYYDVVLVNVQ